MTKTHSLLLNWSSLPLLLSLSLSHFFPCLFYPTYTFRPREKPNQIDMCNKSSSKPPDVVRTRSMIKNKATATSTKSLKPAARKTRTKTRKPKYLSLRLELSQHQTPSSDDMTGHHQLNLFPLHPENMVDDKLISDINDDSNVAYLFHAEGEDTLNGLLTTTTTATTTPATTMSSEEDSKSHAYSYRAQDQCSEGINDYYKAKCLVRTAMRNRERDMSEEKWVCYSEVVEEVTSSGSGAGSACVADDLWSQRRSTNKGSLALKLDYQGILNAWSDKGPLYIQAHGDLDTSPQIVPDLHDDKSSNVLTDGLDSSAGNVWKVPENNGGNATSNLKIKEEEGGKDDWKMGQREASLLRYKEKRQSRLFSKRIRYQVRKLNAEKRPRMKGRFVKRS